MTQQHPFWFVNRSGLRLCGILEVPERPAPDAPMILLLSPGVKMRVGPQGLYRRMAVEYLAQGFRVCRFDFHGLGDSEGVLAERDLRDVYNHIEVGRYVNDTLDAMDWLERQYGVNRFILGGLCGGAITGLLAGERDARAVGLIGLGITPVLAAKSADASRYMTAAQVEASQGRYLRRLLSPTAWWRLVTLQVDFTLIARILRLWIRRAGINAAAPSDPPGNDDNANPLFPPAFFSLLSGRRPILLIFGGQDRLRWEFQEKFVDRHGEALSRLPQTFQVHSVEGANHVLSLWEWQREMLDVSTRWLQRHFAVGFTPHTSNTATGSH